MHFSLIPPPKKLTESCEGNILKITNAGAFFFSAIFFFFGEAFWYYEALDSIAIDPVISCDNPRESMAFGESIWIIDRTCLGK